MSDFTYGGKVQLKLIFLEVFLKIQLFEEFLAILSFCFYCFYRDVLEKPCMYPDSCGQPTFAIKINPRLILGKAKTVST